MIDEAKWRKKAASAGFTQAQQDAYIELNAEKFNRTMSAQDAPVPAQELPQVETVTKAGFDEAKFREAATAKGFTPEQQQAYIEKAQTKTIVTEPTQFAEPDIDRLWMVDEKLRDAYHVGLTNPFTGKEMIGADLPLPSNGPAANKLSDTTVLRIARQIKADPSTKDGINAIYRQAEREEVWRTDIRSQVASLQEYTNIDRPWAWIKSNVNTEADADYQAIRAQNIELIGKMAADRGVDLVHQEGRFMAYDEHGNLHPVTPGFLESVGKAKYEMGGAIAGATMASRIPVNHPLLRLGLLALGGAGGAALGEQADYLASAIDLQEQFDAKVGLEKAIGAAQFGVFADIAGAAAFKAIKGTWTVVANAYNFVKDGNTAGAYRALKDTLGYLSDEQVEQIVKQWEDILKIDPMANKPITTKKPEWGPQKDQTIVDASLREKALAILPRTTPGGEAIAAAAANQDSRVALSLRADLNNRAQAIIAAAKNPADNTGDQLRRALSSYEDGVKAQYAIVKQQGEAIIADRAKPIMVMPEKVMPKLMQVGPGTFKTTPINNTVYHETSLENAVDLIRSIYANSAEQGVVKKLFVADSADLAIGQGSNKGVKIVMDGAYVSGRENVKPGTGIPGVTGKEFQTDYVNKHAIQEITMPAGSKVAGAAKVFLDREFTKTITADGSLVYTKKPLQAAEVTAAPYKFNFNYKAIRPAIEATLNEIADPAKQQRLVSLLEKIESTTHSRTFTDLLDLREALNEFKAGLRSVNSKSKHMANTAVNSSLSEVDKEIDTVMKSSDAGKQWLEDWKSARADYHQYKLLMENGLYKLVTKQGATEKSIAAALVKYGPSLDGTYTNVMSKVPIKVKATVENEIVQQLAQKYTLGTGAGFKAINFHDLANELKYYKFSSAQAQKLQEATYRLAEVYRNDPALSGLGGHLNLGTGQVLATTMQGKIHAYVMQKWWSRLLNVIPGQRADIRAMVDKAAKFMENPLDKDAAERVLKDVGDDMDLAAAIRKIQEQTAQELAEGKAVGKLVVYRDKTNTLYTRPDTGRAKLDMALAPHRVVKSSEVERVLGRPILDKSALTKAERVTLLRQGYKMIVVERNNMLIPLE